MSWSCPKCDSKNPDSRVQCYKRSCNGMPERELRKFIAMIGMSDFV